MRFSRTGTALGAVTAVVALLVAVTTIWLVLADPVAVADAVNDRGAQALAEAVAGAIVEALEQFLRWL